MIIKRLINSFYGIIMSCFLVIFIMENSKQNEKELKQIKSMVGELRKAKLKCLELSEHLNRDLPKLEYYEILQVRCKRTVNNLDKQGLKDLLNELIKSLAELYEAERDLMYDTEKNSFKKIAPPPPPRRERQYYTKQQIGPFKVPTYFSRSEPGANKIQRISNYIQAIGKSMDALRKSMEPNGQWTPKDFLTYEPEYLNIQRRIEQYKMRDEQIIEQLQGKIQEQIDKIVSEGQKIEEGDDFIVMKVPKKKIDEYGKKEAEPVRQGRHDRSFDGTDQQYHPLSMIEPKRRSKSRKTDLQKINQEANNDAIHNGKPNEADQTGNLDLHITSFQKSRPNYSRASKLDNTNADCDQNGNFVYMVKKVSPESQLNSSIISSISSLRSLRKKVFDDDIWDEFQKL